MKRKLLPRVLGMLAVLAAWTGAAEAAPVYSDTVLARGPEFASTTELTLGTGSYRVTATDLNWLGAPLSALSFGVFTSTAPIETRTGPGTLEFFYGGQGKIFLQLYARTASGKSAGLIGVQLNDVAVVALPASLWLLLSALMAMGFSGWVRRQTLLPSGVADAELSPALPADAPLSWPVAARRAVRKLVKPLFPTDARTFIEWAGPRFGRRYAVAAYAKSLLRKDRLVRVPIQGTGEHAYLRPTAADQFVYDEVFISGQYRPPVQNARFIIDAGGHIGLTSLLFALRWPHAKIAVVEPEADNFRVLQANLGSRRNVSLHRAAVWSHEAELAIKNPGDNSVSFRLEEGDGIQAVTIRELMDRNGFTEVDLLKMDIEGAEIEVFATSASWIDAVRSLVVELHDRFRPGCRNALVAASAGRGFASFEQGENTILVQVAASARRPHKRTRRARAQLTGVRQDVARLTRGGSHGK